MEDFQTATQAPISSTARLVAIVGKLGPATQGNDFGGYGIYVEVCPVVAKRRIAGAKATFEPMFVNGGRLTAPSALDHRTQVSSCLCSWPPDQDEAMLRSRIGAMRLRMRLHGEYLRECGVPIWKPSTLTTDQASGLRLVLVGIGVVLAALWVATGTGATDPG